MSPARANNIFQHQAGPSVHVAATSRSPLLSHHLMVTCNEILNPLCVCVYVCVLSRAGQNEIDLSMVTHEATSACTLLIDLAFFSRF